MWPPSPITSSPPCDSAASGASTGSPVTVSTASPTRSGAPGKSSWEHVRHEETAAFAAAADAALTGELAVCAGSCGPGNLHLINGLFDAQRSRVPVLAIAAHIPRTEIGSEYFQETHPQELFRECSVYCELVSTPEMLPRILRDGDACGGRGARRGRRRRPRRDLPAEAPTRRPGSPVRCAPTRSVMRPDDASLRQAADDPRRRRGGHDPRRRGRRRRPRRADRAGRARCNAPIVHALRGKEFIEYDNPFDVGMTGLLGFASGYKAIKEADTLLMLGTDFPYQQFYPDHAKVIQVDIRGRNLGRRTPDRPRPGRHRRRHPGRAAAPAAAEERHATHLDRSLRALSQDAQDARRAGRQRPRPHPDPAGIRCGTGESARRPTTRCSPSTSARRWCGRRAT